MGQAKSKTQSPSVVANNIGDANRIRVLLLGASSQGKSTIFKCFSLSTNYQNFDLDLELIEGRAVIRRNCVAGILRLLEKAKAIDTVVIWPQPWQHEEQYADCILNVNDEIASHIQRIQNFRNYEFYEEYNDQIYDLGQNIDYVWKLDAIQKVFACQHKFWFPENMPFFFDKVVEIMSENYKASKEDWLNARVRTTGTIDFRFERNNKSVHLWDQGSTRNERLKWRHNYFGEATGNPIDFVVFVAGLNHYKKVLFENEQQNSLLESINLFESICNGTPYLTLDSSVSVLQSSKLILLLTQTDLFEQSLMTHPLSICFGDEYQGKNYNDNNFYFDHRYDYSVDFDAIGKLMALIGIVNGGREIPIDVTSIVALFLDLSNLALKRAYDDGIEFITKQYLTKNKVNRRVNVFSVNATDPDAVIDIFDQII